MDINITLHGPKSVLKMREVMPQMSIIFYDEGDHDSVELVSFIGNSIIVRATIEGNVWPDLQEELRKMKIELVYGSVSVGAETPRTKGKKK